MQKYLFLIGILICLSCSKSNENIAGTATDVNSGSIKGCIYSNGNRLQDSVVVGLFATDAKDSIVKQYASVSVNDGNYTFDSLPADTYLVRVIRNDIVLGEEKHIQLDTGKTLVVNINITIIINQFFTITYNNVIVNNIFVISPNSKVVTNADNSINVMFTDRDTVRLNALVNLTNKIDTIGLAIIKQKDSSYVVTTLKNNSLTHVTTGVTIVQNTTKSDSTMTNLKININEETR